MRANICVFYVLDTMLNPLYAFSHLILLIAFRISTSIYLHFTCEETEAEEI